jgi:hypothetical protein
VAGEPNVRLMHLLDVALRCGQPMTESSRVDWLLSKLDTVFPTETQNLIRTKEVSGLNSHRPIEVSSSPSLESRSLPTLPQARLIARPAQPSRSSNFDVLTSEQMKSLQILQREDLDDQEIVERFIKVWGPYAIF